MTIPETTNIGGIIMVKRIQGIVIGMLVAVLLFGGVAAAAAATAARNETISVTFRNIRIVLDGKEFIPKDVDDNIVEPFIYNGTTYLPVRAVSQALDREVSWDGSTSTVYIDSKDPEGSEPPPASEVQSVVITYEGITVTDVTASVDDSFKLRVRVEPVGGQEEIIWVSSNRNVFEVVITNTAGTEATITGKGRGTATLTVSVGGVEAECTIRIR